ncbi:MAG: hypothetical protein GJ676_03925 [Rhodobacteraceae bacterium]|nr:hypothetical protein [Paracoccaceae bacterium]
MTGLLPDSTGRAAPDHGEAVLKVMIACPALRAKLNFVCAAAETGHYPDAEAMNLPLFAKERTAAKFLDKSTKEFRDLVTAGYRNTWLPYPVTEITFSEVRAPTTCQSAELNTSLWKYVRRLGPTNM